FFSTDKTTLTLFLPLGCYSSLFQHGDSPSLHHQIHHTPFLLLSLNQLIKTKHPWKIHYSI
ncbi:hypothetical protein C5167_041806, partial [Papaver somniferum]